MVLEWIKKESDVKRTQICEIMGLFGILIQKEHDEKKKTFAKNEPDGSLSFLGPTLQNLKCQKFYLASKLMTRRRF